MSEMTAIYKCNLCGNEGNCNSLVYSYGSVEVELRVHNWPNRGPEEDHICKGCLIKAPQLGDLIKEK